MKYIVLFVISILFIISCSYPDKFNTRQNTETSCDDNKIRQNNVNSEKDGESKEDNHSKLLCSRISQELGSVILKDFSKNSLYEGYSKDADWFEKNKYWEKYKCDTWLNDNNKNIVRLITDTISLKEFYLTEFNNEYLTFNNKKSNSVLSVVFAVCSEPKYSALRTLFLQIGRGYDAFGKNTEYAVGNASFHSFRNGELYIIGFFRDNVFVQLCGSKDYDSIKDGFKIIDVAKEIDTFIQKQPIVDEYKPATLKFAFENYNVNTYKWESAKDYFQAAFINIESNDNAELYEMMFEDALKKFGLMDDNNNLNDDLLKKREKEFNEIYHSLKYPLRLKIEIADQLGNMGGSAEIAAIFKGQSDAQIPEPLTIENLEKVYDIESEKGIEQDKISWFDDRSADFDTVDNIPEYQYLMFPAGRYIIVIDVITNTKVKSRHFYELKVENKKTD